MKVRLVGDPHSMAGTARYLREFAQFILSKCPEIDLSIRYQQIYAEHTEKYDDFIQISDLISKDSGEADIALHIMMPEHYKRDHDSKYNIGVFFYEADPLPDHLKEHIHDIDGILAPSEFCRRVVGINDRPNDVIHICDLKKYNTSGGVVLYDSHGAAMSGDENNIFGSYTPDQIRTHLGFGQDTYVFLSAFQWAYRKGWDLLLRGYWSTFKSHDDVALIIKTYLNFSEESEDYIIREINNFRFMCSLLEGETPNFAVILTKLSNQDMAKLYELSDCFVLPTRCEGLSKNTLEAMLVGKPVITTDWGGHMDFIHPNDVQLVRSEQVPCFGMHGTFWNLGDTVKFHFPTTSKFAEPSLPSLMERMLAVYMNRDLAKSHGEKQRQYALDTFDPEKNRLVLINFLKRFAS